ncbi:MAG: hypothetical protein HZA53_14810 [Planctomycetes bacterium]|nr:hypothetical protein [Planctomycetota bacterium]
MSLLLLVGAGCRSVASKAWNLGQLHDEATRHRYHGVLESDVEYFLRHEVAGVLRGAGARLAEKDPSGIDDPSQRCLENLIDLQHYSADDSRSRALRVEWFARLAVDDPARLSRERATLALGALGAAIEAGVPIALPKEPAPAPSETVADASAALVRGVRGRIDPASVEGKPAPSVDDACKAIEALVLDREGARRALSAVSQLATIRGLGDAEEERLSKTATELERRLVRQSLAAALKDPEPIVRAAAVEASVACAGVRVLDSMLLHLDREPAPEVLVRLLTIVRDRGLPDAPAELSAKERSAWREHQLDALYALLFTRPEGEVHAAAMLALSRVAGAGFESLREEDWQAWFKARRASGAADANGVGSSS